MQRRKFYQTIVLTAAAAFILLLVVKFRPRIETPTPVPPSKQVKAGDGTFSAENFRHVQRSEEKVDFVLTAERATDTNKGVKVLTHPRLESPAPDGSCDIISGTKGSLDDASKAFRVYEGANLVVSGWECSASGFHLSGDGRATSESEVRFKRGDISGISSSVRYDRGTREVTLEGSVRIEGRGSVMTCERLALSLASHDGQIDGPVVISGPDGTFGAPGGSIRLTEENRLESLELGSPFSGKGPRGSLNAATLKIISDDKGEPSSYRLSGGVDLVGSGQTPLRVSSSELILSPQQEGRWVWSSDSEVVIMRGGERAVASRGEGHFGGKSQPEALLSDTVSGSGELGDFRAERASLKDGVWTLLGGASVARGGHSISAERIGWNTSSGSAEAIGDVHGRYESQGRREPVLFKAHAAEMQPGGFPSKLAQGARIEMGKFSIEAPSIEAVTANRGRAAGGAVGSSRSSAGEEDKISAPVIDYDGDAGAATASGGARAEARGYILTAEVITAKLDAKGHPMMYEAKKNATVKGPEYEGEGDVITFDPAKGEGSAMRGSPEAFVTKRDPYRRVAAQTVYFSPGHIEARSMGESPIRGHLDGVPSTNKGGGGSHSSRGEAKK